MPDAISQPEGDEVYVIAFDEEWKELRLLPTDVTEEVIERSRNLGIGAEGEIVRVKHGPLVAPEPELRGASIASLAAAVDGNYYGTVVCIDMSTPPVNEDMVDIDDRYHLDVESGKLVAVVTERHPQQPPSTPAEIKLALDHIVGAYNCTISDVKFTLAGGGTPEEFGIDFSGRGLDPAHVDQLHAEQAALLAGMAHDVHITITADPALTVATLMDGASALSDYLAATRNGPLDAVGILNLLRGGHFNVLLGESESEYLEAKTAMHPIWLAGTPGEKAKIELAQDVARFANGDVNAILVIGYKQMPGGGNTIGALTPVANAYLNVAQIQEVLDARLVPPVDGLIVDSFSTSATESVLAIYVPRQPSEMQPYLVHGAIAGDKVEGAFFSIVRRRGEGSITTSAQQIHSYIVAGKRYLRGED